jgi:hypothetical protein
MIKIILSATIQVRFAPVAPLLQGASTAPGGRSENSSLSGDAYESLSRSSMPARPVAHYHPSLPSYSNPTSV